ncbi:cytochrome P450 [Mycena capillaripes]|nr:cytochrome P450 [Mycena capillaripes]
METHTPFSPLYPLATSSYAGVILLVSCVVLLAVYVLTDLLTVAPRRVKLPGPSGLPLVGNLFQMRAGHARALANWTELYGGMFRLSLGNREAVIINTYGDMNKTLIQRGAAFQSRPEFGLWHGAFTKALDPEAPTTIGTTKFSEKISKYRRLLTPPTSVAKLSSFNHFSARRYFRFVEMLSDSAKSGVAQDLGRHFWNSTIGTGADNLFGKRFDEDTTHLVAEVNVKAFRQRSLATPVHDYVPLRIARETSRKKMNAPYPPDRAAKYNQTNYRMCPPLLGNVLVAFTFAFLLRSLSPIVSPASSSSSIQSLSSSPFSSAPVFFDAWASASSRATPSSSRLGSGSSGTGNIWTSRSFCIGSPAFRAAS